MTRYRSNRREVIRRLRVSQERALEAAGVFVQGEVMTRSPVDTGRLRDSYEYEVEDNEVTIGSNVEYAPYVEFGTSRQDAQPHLRPSITQNQDRIEELIREEFRRGMR